MEDEILTDYFDNGLSYEILQAKYGRGQQTIMALVKKAQATGRVRTKEPPDRRSTLNAPALSRVHRRIGMRFIQWRTIDNNFTMPEAAKASGMTINRLHAIEGGIHNWSLLELTFTCERMGWTLIDLIRGADLGNYFIADPK